MKELTDWLKAEQERGQDDGNWLYSYRFAELQIAEAWHLKPSEWDRAEMDDKEEMFAFWKCRREMSAWENHLAEQRIEKSRKASKKG